MLDCGSYIKSINEDLPMFFSNKLKSSLVELIQAFLNNDPGISNKIQTLITKLNETDDPNQAMDNDTQKDKNNDADDQNQAMGNDTQKDKNNVTADKSQTIATNTNDSNIDYQALRVHLLKEININDENEKIHFETTLTANYLKTLLNLLKKNEQATTTHAIFELANKEHANFDIRYKLAELFPNIVNEKSISDKTPFLFERTLRCLSEQYNKKKEEIFPNIQVNIRAYLIYQILHTMMDHSETNKNIEFPELPLLMESDSILAFLENMRDMFAGIKQNTDENYQPYIPHLGIIAQLFNSHEISTLHGEKSKTKIIKTIKHIQTLNNYKIKFVDLDKNKYTKNKLDLILQSTTFDDQKWFNLFMQSRQWSNQLSDEEQLAYHLKNELAKKVKLIINKLAEEEDARSIAYIKANIDASYMLLQDYLGSPYNYLPKKPLQSTSYLYEDKRLENTHKSVNNAHNVFTKINNNRLTFDGDNTQNKKYTHIKQILNDSLLRHINFADDSSNIDPIAYLESKEKFPQGTLHYTAPAALTEYLESKFTDELNKWHLKDDNYNTQMRYSRSLRDQISPFSVSFPIVLTASTLLSLYAVIPATILNPINLIITVAAYILGSYIMFIPERITEKNDNNDHHLYHFVLLNLGMAVATVSLYFLLPPTALMFLYCFTPLIASLYKELLLSAKRSALKEPEPTAINFFKEQIKGCSLFDAREITNRIHRNTDSYCGYNTYHKTEIALVFNLL